VNGVERPLRLFGGLQVAVGLLAVLSLFVFAKLPTLQALFGTTETFGKLVASEFFSATITMFLPTLLMGATFPVAARLYAGGAVGRRLGVLYGANTLGAMLGSLVAGFVLIPLLGLKLAALTLALISLLVGTAALFLSPPLPRLRLGGALAVALIGALLLPPGIYLGFREGAIPELKFYREGADATVAVFEVANPPMKMSFVNGRNEVPTDKYSMQAFYMLGHLPPMLRPDARSALMVSFGNGIATGTMSRHGISRIHAVELVAEQLEAAKLYTAENHGVLDYPGLTITVEDGRNYLLRSNEQFDIITADATHPVNASSWALFTREFYTLVQQRMAPNGVFVQWLPFHDLAQSDYRDIIKTFGSVFPHTTLWYTGGSHTFLVATPEPLTRDQVRAMAAQLDAQGFAGDLGGPQNVVNDFLMDEAAVARYTEGAHIVTDDRAFFMPSKDYDAIVQSFEPYVQAGQN
jgi:spermidine synthase